MKKKVMLCILDGWGLAKNSPYNAISEAKKNFFDKILDKYGMVKLFASEQKVGLPNGQFGNSEVGHMNIGAGRVILQDILRIDEGLNNGYIENHQTIKEIKSNKKGSVVISGIQDENYQNLILLINEKLSKYYNYTIWSNFPL